MKNRGSRIKTLIMFLFISGLIFPQTKDEFTFQNFFRGSNILSSPLINFSVDYVTEEYSPLFFNVRTLFPLNEHFEIGGEFSFLTYTTNKINTGLCDMKISVKYAFSYNRLSISSGLYLTIPTGSSIIQQNRSNEGFFISIGDSINSKLKINILGNYVYHSSMKFYDGAPAFSMNDNTGQVGISALYLLEENIRLVFEVTSNDYPYSKSRTLMSLGMNYSLPSKGILRIALGRDLINYGDSFFTLGIIL